MDFSYNYIFRHLNPRFPNCLQACLEQVGCEMSFDLLKPNCIISFLETITCNSIHSLCYNCAIIIEILRLSSEGPKHVLQSVAAGTFSVPPIYRFCKTLQ
ncbi:hypothetical protein BpHYR1_052401 [Brachionus plicatilis]|uniref:Uncharacterized protein n=1 Tax=Brachionus plicatilis TaxID=10195 RepID=A0A3M7PRJ6_BRAPC|nr:hypothetical protein BpHYR1_052401 [Brachionus plicatilis]